MFSTGKGYIHLPASVLVFPTEALNFSLCAVEGQSPNPKCSSLAAISMSILSHTPLNKSAMHPT